MPVETRAFLTNGPLLAQHVGIVARDDEYIVASVAEWAAPALGDGGGVILVGTAGHLAKIRARLKIGGVQVDQAERTGHAVFIEAEWLLAKFIIDGTPERDLFRPLLDEILQRMAARVGSASKIRAWGEMVSLLYYGGKANAALQLEALWEEALQEQGFALMCTYQLPEALPHPTPELMDDVRHHHVHTLTQPGILGVAP